MTLHPDNADLLRARRLAEWLAATLTAHGETATDAPAPLTADASFRRFARITTTAGTRIVVDAPPERENNEGFVTVGAWLERSGLPAARVLSINENEGFLLVSDLGDDTLARRLQATPEKLSALYTRAVDVLIDLQAAALETPPPVPAYDADRLALENAIFGEWFLSGLLDLPPAPAVLTEALDRLSEIHLAAPRVLVHLDWHSRNLMVDGAGEIAFLDYQDARLGPQGYDLISLLRDCYRDLGADVSLALRAHFLAEGRVRGLPGTDDAERFWHTAELVGLQRHMKAIGIFARLHLRERRDHALPDIPRTLRYVRLAAGNHPELASLAAWLDEEVLPAYEARRG